MTAIATPFQSVTPPEWIKHRNAEEALVLLEERLEDFVKWLNNKGVVLWDFNGDELDPGHAADSHALIEEYVNT
jgi:hypothetical protein